MDDVLPAVRTTASAPTSRSRRWRSTGPSSAPGQKFSFWKTIGEVSLRTGYKLGGAIIDGRSVEGKTIGGGICSCSTTIFNAALRAGLEMGARRNHYYYIARYPKGLDATVYQSDGGSVEDMTFTNDTSSRS